MNLWLGLGLVLLTGGMARGACRLENSDWLAEPQWALCADADVQAYGRAQRVGEELDQGSLVAGEVYASFFARHWLSLHGKAHGVSESWQEATTRSVTDQRTEQLFLQLGHPLLNPVHGAVGRLPLPFGLNLDPFRFATSTRSAQFWDSSIAGVRFSLRWRDDMRLEAGGAWKERRELGKSDADSLALRLTQLTDLLGGTKFVASYQVRSGVTDQQRWGLSTLVFSGEDLTSLEWVRITREGEDTFEQLFRFGYQHVQTDWRWDFVYEDVRKDSYTLSLGCRYRLQTALEMSTQVHFRRLRTPEPIHSGTVLIGLRYGLNHTLQGD